MNDWPLLTFLIFSPWVGALILAGCRSLSARAARGIGLGFSLSTLAWGVVAWVNFDPQLAGFQWVEKRLWIRWLDVHYHLGLDGMSLLLVMLTGVVSPMALAALHRVVPAARDARMAGLLFLLLQGCALGVFLALDFFPWFLFWEISLVPAFFLIRNWGGAGARRAAFEFFIITFAGSAFLALAFAAIFASAGTLDFVELGRMARGGELAAKLGQAGGIWPQLVFLGALAGLAVKTPLFPLHTWLPSTYAEAPAGVAMFLTAVMSKMGVYGFLRILWPLFPEEMRAHAEPLIWLAMAGVALGALAALRQADIRRMLAYSSFNHVSYCLLALFAVAAAPESVKSAAVAAALTGAVLQAFNHGLSASALFYCSGILELRGGGSRALDDFGGVRLAAPVFAGLCGFAMFSSIGLPGLNGFVGEFLIFRGVFGIRPGVAAVATIGLVVTALFYLTFWQRVFHGPRAGVVASGFRDLDGEERVILGILAGLMIVFGIAPGLLTDVIDPLVQHWIGAKP